MHSSRLRIHGNDEHEHHDATASSRSTGSLIPFPLLQQVKIAAYQTTLHEPDKYLRPYYLLHAAVYIQGTWTGIYQAGGSLARILGPVYLTTMYTLFGPRATFGSIIAVLLVVIAINLYLFDHLIPLVRRGNEMSPDLARDTKQPIMLSGIYLLVGCIFL